MCRKLRVALNTGRVQAKEEQSGRRKLRSAPITLFHETGSQIPNVWWSVADGILLSCSLRGSIFPAVSHTSGVLFNKLPRFHRPIQAFATKHNAKHTTPYWWTNNRILCTTAIDYSRPSGWEAHKFPTWKHEVHEVALCERWQPSQVKSESSDVEGSKHRKRKENTKFWDGNLYTYRAHTRDGKSCEMKMRQKLRIIYCIKC